MAKIKNIQLKAIKFFNSGRGEGVTANLYIDNKKQGFIHDAGVGGMLEIDFLSREAREIFSDRVQAYYEENPASQNSEEDFIEELLQLAETEKVFKQSTKKGFPITIKFQYHKRTDSLEEMFANGFKHAEMVSVANEEVVAEQLEERQPVEYKVYRTLEDFIIQ